MHRHISPWALKRGKVIFKSLSFPLALSRISKVLTTTMPLTPKLIKPHGAGVDRAGGGGGEVVDGDLLGAGQENGTHIWKKGEQQELDKSPG